MKAILLISAAFFTFYGGICGQSPAPITTIKDKKNELITKGSELQGTGKFEEALKVFQELLRLDPNDAETVTTIAGCYSQMEKPEEAIVWAKKAVEMAPKLAGARINYGNILFLEKKYKEAEVEFRKAVELDPNEVLAKYGLAITLQELKKYEEALAMFLKVVDADPKMAQASYSAAEVYYRLGKLDKSIEMVEKTLRVDPNYDGAKTMLRTLNEEKAGKQK